MKVDPRLPAILATDYGSGQQYWKSWSSDTIRKECCRIMSRRNADGTFKVAAVVEQEGYGKEAVTKDGIKTDKEVVETAESFMAAMKTVIPEWDFKFHDFTDCDTFEKFQRRWDEYGLVVWQRGNSRKS